MTTIGISTMEEDGKFTAYSAGASFRGEDLWKLQPGKEYVINFPAGADDDQPVRIYAVDDTRAAVFAREKYIPPFMITEKITTWRHVGEFE